MPNSLHFFSTILWGISAYSSQCFVSKNVKGLILSVARIPCAHTALWLPTKPGTLGVSNTVPPELQSLPLSPKSPSQRLPGFVPLLGINRKMSAALWVCLGYGHLPIYDFVLREHVFNRPLMSIITLKLQQTQKQAFWTNPHGLYVMYRFP